jgi:cation transport protein ChaC
MNGTAVFQSPEALAAGLPEGTDFWVFGYGSLMWDPGFEFLARSPALLRGYHRRFCIYSHRHRGTPERPGLVFGLDRGGACRGIGFRIDRRQAPAVLAYLWQREMVSNVYQPRLLPVRLESGAMATACTFVVDRRHPQYCGRLALATMAGLIRQAVGGRGPNLEYLVNTLEHLGTLGITDHGLTELLAAVQSEEGRPS